MPTKIVHNYFIFITFLLYLCYTLFHPCGFAFGRVGRGRSKALAPIGLYFTPRNAKGMSSGMIMALKMTAVRVELTTDLHGSTRIYCSAVCMLSRGSVHRRLACEPQTTPAHPPPPVRRPPPPTVGTRYIASAKYHKIFWLFSCEIHKCLLSLQS